MTNRGAEGATFIKAEKTEFLETFSSNCGSKSTLAKRLSAMWFVRSWSDAIRLVQSAQMRSLPPSTFRFLLLCPMTMQFPQKCVGRTDSVFLGLHPFRHQNPRPPRVVLSSGACLRRLRFAENKPARGRTLCQLLSGQFRHRRPRYATGKGRREKFVPPQKIVDTQNRRSYFTNQ